MCGQYPGAVPDGATVDLECACGLKKYRYVIVQFPIDDKANICEVEVYVRGKSALTFMTCRPKFCLPGLLFL